MQVRKQQLELDMEQQTGSKYKKEYVKAVYCHPAYLTYMQSTSWETLDGGRGQGPDLIFKPTVPPIRRESQGEAVAGAGARPPDLPLEKIECRSGTNS